MYELNQQCINYVNGASQDNLEPFDMLFVLAGAGVFALPGYGYALCIGAGQKLTYAIVAPCVVLGASLAIDAITTVRENSARNYYY